MGQIVGVWSTKSGRTVVYQNGKPSTNNRYMANQPGGWLGKLGNLLVPASQPAPPLPAPVSNKRILDELVAGFNDSIHRESVGTSLLFDAHFLIILHPDTYEDRQNAFPVVVNEAVQAFNASIDAQREHYQRVSPVASAWYFKFGAGREFAGETITPTDVKVVGALTGILPGNALPGNALPGQPPIQDSSDKIRVTRRVKQTNRYEKVDVDLSAFQHIDFREPGAFVVKFGVGLAAAAPVQSPVIGATRAVPPSLPRRPDTGLAQIDYYVAETNTEHSYVMHDREIIIARKEPDNAHFPNYLLLESAYVSNPHARIRYSDATQGFQIASFSRNETRVNEQLIPRSEPASPQWVDLPDPAQILLNSMVTLQFQANT